MEIPENIKSIIKKIEESENDWKANYMANWGFSYQLKSLENTPKWNLKIKFGLPAFRKKYHEYTPAELHRIITSKDVKNTYENLIVLFSLFEALLQEISKILLPSKFREDFLDFGIRKFFEDERIEGLLEESELKELYLAKETRNCYVHNSGKANDKWLGDYENAKGTLLISEGDDLNKGFEEGIPYHQIEEWHHMIVKITEKIKNKIKEI